MWLRQKASAARARDRAARATAEMLRLEITDDEEVVAILDPGSLGVGRFMSDIPRWGVHMHWSPDMLLNPWRHLSGEGVPRALLPLVEARMYAVGRRNERLLRSAPFLITLTSSHTRNLRVVNGSVYEIPNPVDLGSDVSRPVPRPQSILTIGYVGRLSHEKGPDVLIDAYAQARAFIAPSRMVVAGSGPEEERVLEQADVLGLDDIEFLGWIQDPLAVLRNVDVLVLPSRVESVPLVLIEALAAGCQVVAADAGSGVRDVLDGGRLGRIVPVDDVEALALAIRDASEDVRNGRFNDPALVEAAVGAHEPGRVLDSWIRFLRDQTTGGARLGVDGHQ